MPRIKHKHVPPHIREWALQHGFIQATHSVENVPLRKVAHHLGATNWDKAQILQELGYDSIEQVPPLTRITPEQVEKLVCRVQVRRGQAALKRLKTVKRKDG